MTQTEKPWLESPDHGQGLDQPRHSNGHRNGADVCPRAPDDDDADRRIRVAVVNHQALLTHVLRPALERHEGIDVVLDLDNPHANLAQLSDAQPDVVLLRTDVEQDNDMIRAVADYLGSAKLIVLSGSEGPANKTELMSQAFAAGATGYVSLSLPLSAVIEAIVNDDDRRTGRIGASTPPRRDRQQSRDQYLTEREREVLRRFAGGESTRTIAAELGVSLATVRTHTQNILTKLGVHSKVEAAAYAARNNLT
jgi:two-component system, NarL family, nitrate/nitrite response regulator NarL